MATYYALIVPYILVKVMQNIICQEEWLQGDKTYMAYYFHMNYYKNCDCKCCSANFTFEICFIEIQGLLR